MKYPASTMAKALARALHDATPETSEKIGKNFITIVKKYDALKKSGAILDEASRIKMSAEGRRRVLIQTARPLPQEKLAVIKKLFSDKDVISEKTDPALIAGVKITVNDEEMLDNTLKRKLEKLFVKT